MQIKKTYLEQVLDAPKNNKEHDDEMEDCDQDLTRPARSGNPKRPTVRRKWVGKEDYFVFLTRKFWEVCCWVFLISISHIYGGLRSRCNCAEHLFSYPRGGKRGEFWKNQIYTKPDTTTHYASKNARAKMKCSTFKTNLRDPNEEKANLKSRLREAEGKIVFSNNATESVHSVIEPPYQWLSQAHRICKTFRNLKNVLNPADEKVNARVSPPLSSDTKSMTN